MEKVSNDKNTSTLQCSMNTRAYTGHQYGSYIVHEYNGMPQPTYDEQVVSLASSGWIWKQTVLRFSWPFSLFIPKTYCIEQDPYVWYWLTSLPCTSVFPVCFWLWRDFNLENHSKGSDFRTEILKKMGALNVFWKGNRCISQHCAKTDCKDIPFFMWDTLQFF